MVDIRCTYPTHPDHSGEPGWTDDVLATADRLIDGMICEGCAAYDATQTNGPATIAVQVDPTAVSEALTAAAKATTVKALSVAVVALGQQLTTNSE